MIPGSILTFHVVLEPTRRSETATPATRSRGRVELEIKESAQPERRNDGIHQPNLDSVQGQLRTLYSVAVARSLALALFLCPFFSNSTPRLKLQNVAVNSLPTLYFPFPTSHFPLRQCYLSPISISTPEHSSQTKGNQTLLDPAPAQLHVYHSPLSATLLRIRQTKRTKKEASCGCLWFPPLAIKF